VGLYIKKNVFCRATISIKPKLQETVFFRIFSILNRKSGGTNRTADILKKDPARSQDLRQNAYTGLQWPLQKTSSRRFIPAILMRAVF